MEDYTDIILLSRDLMMHKEEANTLECDKMRFKRCIEKLKQDMEYEKLNLERDRKRLKKGQQTYAKLCNAKSELHKSLLEKERLKQTMDEDTKQLRYKIQTMTNQLEMEQTDIQKLAMDDFHEDEFDENSSNEILLNLETTGQELVLYSQDLFCLNKKIKQSAWRLKYLSCQLTPDSVACDLSSDEEECSEEKKAAAEARKTSKPRSYSVSEVQATADQHCTEVQVSSHMTIKSIQTDCLPVTNDSVQTTERNQTYSDKYTEASNCMESVATQTDEMPSTPRKSNESKETSRRESIFIDNSSRRESTGIDSTSRRESKGSEETKHSTRPSKTSIIDPPIAESTRILAHEEVKPTAKCPEEVPIKVAEEVPIKVLACDDACPKIECQDSPTKKENLVANISKTENKVTQTVQRCEDEVQDYFVRCMDLTRDQTSQTAAQTVEVDTFCQPSCSTNCAHSKNICQPMYQNYYASAQRMSQLCYPNDCVCAPPMMMYSRDCTPTYCNLTTPNQVPVRECASPPEQLGSMLPLPNMKDAEECRDLQSDQYPTKDESDLNRESKIKSAPNFGHYSNPTHNMPASYPTISQNRNQQIHQTSDNWPQDNELNKQDYPPNFSAENFFNPNLPTQDTRSNLLVNPQNSLCNRDDSYYQVNVSPPEDCWTEIQSRFTGLLSLYTSDRMTANSDSDLDSVISTRPTFHPQPKQKSTTKSSSQVISQKKGNRNYKQ